MPGRGSYGPGGKWIYTRAKKLRAKNPDMAESTSFAIATQQAHKVGKSPKGFRTAEGVRTAKAKMQGPVKEYRKTAGAEEMMAKRLKTLCSLRDKGFTSDRENKEIEYLRDQLGEGGALKTASFAGLFDELEKAASLAAAARFGVGVLLGSLLWNSMGGEEKQELKERAQEATGERGMPPIVIAPGREQQSLVEREMGKPDPDFRGVMGDLFKRPEDLERERRIRGVRQMWKGAMADPQRDPAAQARKVINRTSKVGQFGTKKPPEPNIRAVATKI